VALTATLSEWALHYPQLKQWSHEVHGGREGGRKGKLLCNRELAESVASWTRDDSFSIMQASRNLSFNAIINRVSMVSVTLERGNVDVIAA
jgi:hypothetical protein